ncbi:MAG: BrnA antitoxin family protein [Methylococcaceae bacterium]|nr:BrnA antitoxin family protein [Methylococcaceae bacterium]MDZ4156087.1 BrnA antitoxin family protein [Methylococcales bacterium]MDP2395094.1 BrnA antitoxin family protein [Methylococcaceae bacterium]MDP3018764.1 BrnA antitoxin family protein [Methylococcaceae bacterium]MDP3390519.1 BrnA antitoxin family protein [Methylococcaceae bacterium]
MTNRFPLTDADGEVRELTDADFKRMRPASDVLPEIFGAELAAEMLKPKGGRPRTDTPKVFTGIRLDPDVLEAFRATGKGWQTRMNNALKEWLREHTESI